MCSQHRPVANSPQARLHVFFSRPIRRCRKTPVQGVVDACNAPSLRSTRCTASSTECSEQSVEDGLAEDDCAGWRKLTKRLGDKIQLVGDDVFVTNPKIFERGIRDGIANSLLIKLNQIGTVPETLLRIELTRTHGYTAIVSHRSGETHDTAIADLSVATGVGISRLGHRAVGKGSQSTTGWLKLKKSLEVAPSTLAGLPLPNRLPS